MSTREADEAARVRFAADTENHTMTVAHDDGLYRHLRFAAPETSMYWFDVITWPGHLTLTGDMGTYTFRRAEDMFGFFRGQRGINPGYWGEKVLNGTSGGNREVQEYDGDSVTRHTSERLAEFFEHGGGADWPEDVREELRQAVKDEVLTDDWGNSPPHSSEAAHGRLSGWSFRATRRKPTPPSMTYALGAGDLTETYRFEFYDTWEWDFQEHTVHFLWSCWAIKHAIATYDAHKAATTALPQPAEETR